MCKKKRSIIQQLVNKVSLYFKHWISIISTLLPVTGTISLTETGTPELNSTAMHIMKMEKGFIKICIFRHNTTRSNYLYELVLFTWNIRFL